MFYEPPAVQYRGDINEVLHGLLARRTIVQDSTDWRIAKLLTFIESQRGRLGWDLNHVCQELRLNISGPYAARLFKRCMGLGIREHVKKRRLLMAAERLKIADLPVKVIAAECGYRSVAHFSRRFKEQFHASPTEYRKIKVA